MWRVHLFEFHELAWYPSAWRNLLTDLMTSLVVSLNLYRPIIPKLKTALATLHCRRVVDLCSGAGGTTVSVFEQLGKIAGEPVTLVLTDKYPHASAYRHLTAKLPGRVAYSETPVDARMVPQELEGFRTLFTSFHHFKVSAAREILRDAVRKNQGIGIFEYTERNFLVWVPALLLGPVFTWVMTPFTRPFSWQRLLWTYVLPLWMLPGFWDGLVSCLRTYSPRQLGELTADLDAAAYSWEIARVRSTGPFRVTYLLGVPHGGTGGTAQGDAPVEPGRNRSSAGD